MPVERPDDQAETPPADQPEAAGQPPAAEQPAAGHPGPSGYPAPGYLVPAASGVGPLPPGAQYPYPAAVPVTLWWDVFRTGRDERRDAVVVVVALAVVGVLAGWVWTLLAPRDQYRVVEGGLLPVDGESEAFVAGDMIFVILLSVVALLALAVVWSRPRLRGPLVLAALVVGVLAAGAVAWQVGELLAPPPTQAAMQTVGATIEGPLRLRAFASLVVPPVIAVIGYLLCAVLVAPDDLGWSRRTPDTQAPPTP